MVFIYGKKIKIILMIILLFLLTSCREEKIEVVLNSYISDLFEKDDLKAELRIGIPLDCGITLPLRDEDKRFYQELGEKVGDCSVTGKNQGFIYFSNFADVGSKGGKANISLVRINIRNIKVKNKDFETLGFKIVLGENFLEKLSENKVRHNNFVIKINVVNDDGSDILVTGKDVWLSDDSLENYFNKKVLSGGKLEIILSELSNALILKKRSTFSFYVTREKNAKHEKKDYLERIKRREMLKEAAAAYEVAKGNRELEEMRHKQEGAAAEEARRKQEAAAAEEKRRKQEAAAAEEKRRKQEAATVEEGRYWQSEHDCSLFIGRTVKNNTRFPNVAGNPVVTLKVRLNLDRTLKEVKVVVPSGYPEFDIQVVRGIGKSSLFPINCPDEFTYEHYLKSQ